MQINVKLFDKFNIRDSLFLNNVVFKTYTLLSSTILFSSLVAYFSVLMNFKYVGFLFSFLFLFFLFYLIDKYKNNLLGLVLVYVYTGFLGYTLGPIVNMVLRIPNGNNIVCFSFLVTGSLFFILSLYAFVSKRNFNFLNGFLCVGVFVVLFTFILNLFFSIKLLSLLISAFMIVLSSGWILYYTNSFLRDGEENYILITIALYAQIYNIFTSILSIFYLTSDD